MKKIVCLLAVLTVMFSACGERNSSGVEENQGTGITDNARPDDEDGILDDGDNAAEDMTDGASDAVKDATDGAAGAVKSVTDGASNAVKDMADGADNAVNQSK